MTTWISDDNGNKCSVEYFGSEEEAQKALDSLRGCRNCINCTDCTGCTDCYRCSRCTDCTGCSRCTDCTGCSRCTDCTGCSRCSDQNEKIGDLVFPHVSGLTAILKDAVSREEFDLETWETDCGSPLCLGGHIVHSAGAEGIALKDRTSFPFAAMQIAKASGVDIPPTWFYGDTETAIKRVNSLPDEVTQ